jgi:DivIVA domain-containing protein
MPADRATPRPPVPRLSPRAVRIADFTHRRRGLDVDEVHDFLNAVADQMEAADAERARLRAENDSLRQRLDASADPEAAINPRAIALFSQAQQVADNLVAEAVDHARTLMKETRRQQRELLEKARAAGVAPAAPTSNVAQHPAVPEVEYVRTFAQVAQVQLRSVLEALTEQVDRLNAVSSQPGQGAPSPSAMMTAASVLEPISGPVHWRFDKQEKRTS